MPTTIDPVPPVISEHPHPELLVHSATSNRGLHVALLGLIGSAAVLVAMVVLALLITVGL